VVFAALAAGLLVYGAPNVAADEQAASTPAGQPKAEVPQPSFEFTDVWADQQLEHTFVIRNAGDAPLQITQVRPACGCTVAGDYPKEIAPGEEGKFPFRLNTRSLKGKFTKAITVGTNDPANAQIRLTLTGTVKHPIDVDPARGAFFGQIKRDAVVSRKITITNNTDESLNLTLDSKASSGCFQVDLAEKEPGKVYELTVTAHPPYQSGLNRHNVVLTTNNPKQPTITVPCMAEILERIDIRPARINVPHSSASTTPSLPRKVRISNNGDTPLKLGEATATDPRLTVEVKELQPGVHFDVIVNIPGGYSPEAGTAVVVKTDDKEFPELRIPIEGLARGPRASVPSPAVDALKGKPAPGHTVATHGGGSVKIGPDSGKVQALVFYASWCGYCRKALPVIEQLHEKYTGRPDVEIIAINLDDRTGPRAKTEEQTIDHYKSLNLQMPLVLDRQREIGNAYKVERFPTIFVLGKTGTVEAVHVGAPAGLEKQLETELEALVAGKSLAINLPPPIREAKEAAARAASSTSDGSAEAPASADAKAEAKSE
jgi:thiol-disulfide isomerase/thioredoxin